VRGIVAGFVIAVVARLAAVPASADVVWLCRPGIADDPCELPLDRTIRDFGQPDRVETPARDAGERLRLRLAGSDSDLVTGVDFKVGDHRVARDASAPFARTIARRALGRRGALRAVVTLAQGQRQRRVLRRPRPGCAP
jgi:hypothetical protein